MAYIKHLSDHQIAGPLERQYSAAKARAGGVANIIKVMNLDAKSSLASIRFYTRLMQDNNALSACRREMLATVVSNLNGCYY